MMTGIPSTRVTGYAYEADYHCTMCTANRFGRDGVAVPDDATDDEGNPVGAIFADSDVDAIHVCPDHDGLFCTRCGTIGKPYDSGNHTFGWETFSLRRRGINTDHPICPNCGARNDPED